jgi:hypothetical protein
LHSSHSTLPAAASAGFRHRATRAVSGLANENAAERSLGWRGGQESQHFKGKRLASLQALDILVAGEGFEPATFGL